jgi:hypothetical protein
MMAVNGSSEKPAAALACDVSAAGSVFACALRDALRDGRCDSQGGEDVKASGS